MMRSGIRRECVYGYDIKYKCICRGWCMEGTLGNIIYRKDIEMKNI